MGSTPSGPFRSYRSPADVDFLFTSQKPLGNGKAQADDPASSVFRSFRRGLRSSSSHGNVAQSGEQQPVKLPVGGSIPPVSAWFRSSDGEKDRLITGMSWVRVPPEPQHLLYHPFLLRTELTPLSVSLLGCRQAVRHGILTPGRVGSTPSTPVILHNNIQSPFA